MTVNCLLSFELLSRTSRLRKRPIALNSQEELEGELELECTMEDDPVYLFA